MSRFHRCYFFYLPKSDFLSINRIALYKKLKKVGFAFLKIMTLQVSKYNLEDILPVLFHHQIVLLLKQSQQDRRRNLVCAYNFIFDFAKFIFARSIKRDFVLHEKLLRITFKHRFTSSFLIKNLETELFLDRLWNF